MYRKLFAPMLLVTLCLMMSSVSTAYADSTPRREYQIKAAFLYNFGKFIDWPTDAPANASTSIILCVLGEDPFGFALDALEGKAVNDRTLTIKRLVEPRSLDACHILFISPSERARMTQILGHLKRVSILTVGDIEGFTHRGGIINFTIKKNKVRFEINVDAAKQADLRISSKLLKLAEIVKNK